MTSVIATQGFGFNWRCKSLYIPQEGKEDHVYRLLDEMLILLSSDSNVAKKCFALEVAF